MVAMQASSKFYDPSEFSAPVLMGWAFRLFVWVLESFLGRLLLAPKILRDSGFPQALRETLVTEPPTFAPSWPSGSIAQDAEQRGEVVLSSPDPVQRAGQAFHALSGELGKRAEPKQSISAYAAAYRSGATTPMAVAQRIVAEVEGGAGWTPPQCYFQAFNAADVLQQAEDSMHRLMDNRPRSVLEGVPFCVKDNFHAKPYPSTGGTTFLAERRPAYTESPMVTALKACGAVLLGKTNMTEMGTSALGYNALTGFPRNPHNRQHLPGASSSGTAVAVAAGLCPFGLGTDAGGSVRIPAALCGISGLLPSKQRMPREGSVQITCHVGCAGVLAGSLPDAALVYAVIANTGTAIAPPVTLLPRAQHSLAGVRLGVFRPWNEHADPEVVACTSRALGTACDLGAQVVEVTIPDLGLSRVGHATALTSEFAHNAGSELKDGLRSRMLPETRLIIALGEMHTASDYLQSARIRTHMAVIWEGVFQQCDAVFTPTCAITAPKIRPEALECGMSDLQTSARLMRYVTDANLLGLPALTLPAGHDSAGMPIGVQLIGPAFGESTLLSAGATLEAALSQHCQPPSSWHTVL